MLRPSLRAGALSVAILAAFASTSAHAADMPFPVEMPPAVNEGPVEWGSNWYLRGDFGISKTTPDFLNGVALSRDFPNNWNIGLGGGYKFNSWFRGDVTVDYQSLYNKNAMAADQSQTCPTGMYFSNPPLNTKVDYTTAQCTPLVRNRTESMAVFANGYVDLGNWYGLTPYVGAGVGLNVLYQKSAMNWFMNNGVSYAGVTYTDPRNGATYMENWDTKYEGTHVRFAYAFMGGVAYDLTDHLKVDVGYRYANLGKIDGVDQYRNRVSRDIISHQVRVGFRYMIDGGGL